MILSNVIISRPLFYPLRSYYPVSAPYAGPRQMAGLAGPRIEHFGQRLVLVAHHEVEIEGRKDGEEKDEIDHDEVFVEVEKKGVETPFSLHRPAISLRWR